MYMKTRYFLWTILLNYKMGVQNILKLLDKMKHLLTNIILRVCHIKHLTCGHDKKIVHDKVMKQTYVKTVFLPVNF
jgi:hypothetical protein